MASRYWVGGNANWDATAGTKWALTSGGTGGQAVPLATDDVFLDNGTGTGNVTISATSVCKTFNCTGYVGTLAGSSQLTVSGSVTLASAMTITYTGTMIVAATCTLTSNTKQWPTVLQLNCTNFTYTLADAWVLTGSTGTLNCVGSASCVINGFTITMAGSLSNTSSSTISGTTNLIMNGTGTWTGASGGIANNIEFNTAGTITISGTVYKSGTSTLLWTAGTMVTTGSTLYLTGTITFTHGTTVWNNLNINNGTYTLSANLTLNGTLNHPGSGSTVINGNTIYIAGSLTHASSSSISGTTNFVMNGTGTWSGAANGIANNLEFNTAGTITVSGTVYKTGTSTILWTAGTIVTTGSTLFLSTAVTLTLVATVWNNLTLNNGTTTLSASLTLNGNLITGGGGSTIVNGNTLYIGGNLTMSSSASFSGTTNFVMNGTGTWSVATTSNAIANNLTFNTAGTITISGIVYKNGIASTITYTSGTMITTSSTLTITADIIIDTAGMSWYNVSPTGVRTLTLNSLMSVTGLWTTVAATTFNGTAGWSIASWLAAAPYTITFKNGVTYTTTTAVTMTGTSAAHAIFTSDDATIKAIWTLAFGAVQSMVYVNGTRIDSSLGQTVWTFGGTLTSTINWNIGSPQTTVSYPFI